VNCSEFARWLDQGMPAADAAAANAHAGSCAACARALEVALDLDTLLTAVPAAAPAAFTDQVMARVAAAEHALAHSAPLPAVEAIPWWVRAAADPATVGAFVVAALLAGFGNRLLALAAAASWQQLVAPLAGWGEALSERLASLALEPAAWLGIGLAVLPLVLYATLFLYRQTERLTLGLTEQ
jgi:hypothetical protein